MDYQQYICHMKEFQNSLLTFLENDDDSDQDYENLIFFLQSKQDLKDRMIFNEILRLISNITKNHHRLPDFDNKIKKILIFLKNDIKQTFSNFDICNIFKNNKLVLLFLLDINIITLDKSILSFYEQYYFCPEIEQFVDNEMKEMMKDDLLKFDESTIIDFDKKRRKGANDLNICELIRNDSIDEFIIFINRTNTSLQSTQIEHSIFETNDFLLNKNPTLIEYAAFYGSIQIFQYLRLNNVQLNSSLWLYAIHSKNAELIHLLEADHIQPPEESYLKCFEEAIKCHHNDIANYFQENYLSNDSFSSNCFQYYNYNFFPNEISNYYEFFFKYDYIKIVSIFSEIKFYNNNNIRFSPLCIAIENNCYEVINCLYKIIDKINEREFYQCNKIKEMEIPSSIKYIGEQAFEDSSLIKLSIPSSVIKIEQSAFRRCLRLIYLSFLASVDTIEKSTFRECASLVEITIPSSVKYIGDWSFQGCASLKKINFLKPSSLISIGEYAFFSCIKLEQISIPSSVESIKQSAFENCLSLKQLTFESPSSLTSIGAFAFESCVALSSFSIPSSVTSIGTHAFKETYANSLLQYMKCSIC